MSWFCGSVLETARELTEQKRMQHKVMKIMDNTARPLHSTVMKQQSVFSRRLLQLCRNTKSVGVNSCQQ